MTVHIFFTYPETSRKSLEEIDVLFDSDVPPWRSAKVQAHALEARTRKIGVDQDGRTQGDVKEKDSVTQQEVVV